MEYLSETVLSGVVYDLVKNGLQISTQNLRERLRGWLINDNDLMILAKQINEIDVLDDLSESAICKRLEKNSVVQDLIFNIQQSESTTNISQNHSGSGDNIGGNKIINH